MIKATITCNRKEMAAVIGRLKKDGWKDTMNIIQYTMTTATFEMGLNIAPREEEYIEDVVALVPIPFNSFTYKAKDGTTKKGIYKEGKWYAPLEDQYDGPKPFKCKDEDMGRERCPDRCKECQRFY